MHKTPKRPAGVFQLAKLIGDIATGQTSKPEDNGKDPAAVALGRKGGLKGGAARAASLRLRRSGRQLPRKRLRRAGKRAKDQVLFDHQTVPQSCSRTQCGLLTIRSFPTHARFGFSAPGRPVHLKTERASSFGRHRQLSKRVPNQGFFRCSWPATQC
jgi:hypothetical protein